MARLDEERIKKLQPKRMQNAIKELSKIGIEIYDKDDTVLRFAWKGSFVSYFPYSGWASGKTINDGRGLANLLKQLDKLVEVEE